jgi:hypothetical protein
MKAFLPSPQYIFLGLSVILGYLALWRHAAVDQKVPKWGTGILFGASMMAFGAVWISLL